METISESSVENRKQEGLVLREVKINSIGELFERKAHLFSTRTAEAFEAVDKTTGQKALLWLLRFPLQAHSEDAQKYVRRLNKLSQLSLPGPKIRSYGVDNQGIAFLVADYAALQPLFAGVKTIPEAEKTFLGIVKIVADIHKAGISLGDISEGSFALDQQKNPLILGVMGSHDSGARQTAMMPPAETFHYLAPEQRSGNAPDAGSDVYALGVLGYRLFTGRYLLGDKPVSGQIENLLLSCPAPTVIRSDLPQWVDDILGACLESAELRFHDAGELYVLVDKSIQTKTAPGGTHAWARRTVVVTSRQVREARKSTPPKKAAEPKTAEAMPVEEDEPGKDRTLVMFVWAVALVLGVATAGFILFALDALDFSAPGAEKSEEGDDPIRFHLGYAPPELKPLIAELSSNQLSLDKRKESLQRISESSDPIAYAVLIATMKSGPDGQLRQLAQQLLIDRIKRQGLNRSSTVLQRWFDESRRTGKEPGNLPAYPQLLAACDTARPAENRRSTLQQAFLSDPVAALQLAAALALDDSEEIFSPLVRKFLSAELPESELQDKGVGALLFSHKALAGFIDDNFAKTLERFSDQDLRWVLSRAAEQKKPQLFGLADEALRRKVFSPFHSVFLQALVENGPVATPPSVQQALIKGVTGEIGENEIRQYVLWTSISVEKILLAACATAKDPAISQSAFDMLSGRSLRSEPANTLVGWIKGRFWEHRRQAAKSIGVLGLIDVASPENVDAAFQGLMPFSSGGMFQIMVLSGNSELILQALQRLGEITPSEDILPLLANKNKRVRLAAVETLRGRNELAVLQGILHAFETEQDEEVRATYEKHHWVTRNRGRSTVRKDALVDGEGE